MRSTEVQATTTSSVALMVIHSGVAQEKMCSTEKRETMKSSPAQAGMSSS